MPKIHLKGSVALVTGANRGEIDLKGLGGSLGARPIPDLLRPRSD